jgi:hypothetical protein
MSQFVGLGVKRGISLMVVIAFLALVSGAVYVSMRADAIRVGVTIPEVIFVYGIDSTEAGAEIGPNLTYLSFSSLSGCPNATRIYGDSAGIKNIEITGGPSHIIELRLVSWTGDTSWVSSINVKLMEGSTQVGNQIDLVSGGSTGNLSLPAGTTWRIRWEIRWEAGCPEDSQVGASFSLSTY